MYVNSTLLVLPMSMGNSRLWGSILLSYPSHIYLLDIFVYLITNLVINKVIKSDPIFTLLWPVLSSLQLLHTNTAIIEQKNPQTCPG